MIDLESTGVDFDRDDILEVAALEVDYVGGYWMPGRALKFRSGTSKRPESEFAKEHMTPLYDACGRLSIRPAEEARELLVNFFRDCGVVRGSETFLMGWNASNFDVPFLHRKGWLKPPRYTQVDGKDVMTGDHHYRIYEIGGAIAFAGDVSEVPQAARRKALTEDAKKAWPMELPDAKAHDALYDCYAQLQTLNGLIKLTRGLRG